MNVATLLGNLGSIIRSPDGSLQAFELAEQAGVSVVPIVIQGTSDALGLEKHGGSQSRTARGSTPCSRPCTPHEVSALNVVSIA